MAGTPRWVRAIQWLWERVTIPIGEEHMLRRPLLTVQGQGFQVERAERSKLGIVERLGRQAGRAEVAFLTVSIPIGKGAGRAVLGAWLRTRNHLRCFEDRPDPTSGHPTCPISSQCRATASHV